MLDHGQENAYKELRTGDAPPRFGISFPNQFCHATDEGEMWLDLRDVRQESNVPNVERFYNVRIYEDGFTEIKYDSKLSRGYIYRGETLQAALIKAREGGMDNSTWLAIRHKIREGIGGYQKWIAMMGSVAEVPLPEGADQ